MATNWSCPDADQIMNVGDMANREQWLAVRRQGVGASDMATLMGEGKYADSTEYDLWLEKTDRMLPKDSNLAMELGTLYEDVVAQKFAAEAAVTIQRRGTMRSKKHPEVFCNPDRLVDDGGGLECKTANIWVHKQMPAEPEIRRDWYWQMVTNIAVTGRSHWYLAALFGIGGGAKWETRVLQREDCLEDIERIWEVAPAWYRKHILGDEPPELGVPEELTEAEQGSKREATVPLMAWADAQEWRDLRRQKKGLEERLDQLKEQFKQELGTSQILTVRGVPIVRMQSRQGNLTFKKTKFVQANPLIDINEFYERNKTSYFPVLIGDDE